MGNEEAVNDGDTVENTETTTPSEETKETEPTEEATPPEETEQPEEITEENEKEIVEEEQVEEEDEEDREPIVFYLYDGLSLKRDEKESRITGGYSCVNDTGMDVRLIGARVKMLDGWSLVGSDFDFKNQREGIKELRLKVKGQTITEEGEIDLRNIIFRDGEEINVPISIEMGPFRNGLNASPLSIVLIFEEVVYEEVKEEIVIEDKVEVEKENSDESVGSTPIENEENISGENEMSNESSSTESTTDVVEDATVVGKEENEELETQEEIKIEDSPDEEESTLDEESGSSVDADEPLQE